MNSRRAQVDDIGMMIELLTLMQAESPVYRPFTPDYAKAYKILLEFIMQPKLYAAVLEDGTGMFLGKLEDSFWFTETVAWEEILFVKKEHRGTSRAVELMQGFEAWAKEQGAYEIRQALTTDVTFDKTFDFYESMGYKPIGAFFHKEV